jgi:hypothetical protein
MALRVLRLCTDVRKSDQANHIRGANPHQRLRPADRLVQGEQENGAGGQAAYDGA